MKYSLVLTLIILIACNTSHHVKVTPSVAKLYVLKVEFSLDTSTYEHTFRITNQNDDTLSVTRPGVQNSTAILTLIDTAGHIRTERCFTSNERGIEWLELRPHEPVEIKGQVSLKQQFCKVSGNEQLAYRYLGYYKTTSGQQGVCVFTIAPTDLDKLQSMTMDVPVF